MNVTRLARNACRRPNATAFVRIPLIEIAVVVAHFLIEMACGEHQAEEQADADAGRVGRVGQRVAEQEVQRAAEQSD